MKLLNNSLTIFLKLDSNCKLLLYITYINIIFYNYYEY